MNLNQLVAHVRRSGRASLPGNNGLSRVGIVLMALLVGFLGVTCGCRPGANDPRAREPTKSSPSSPSKDRETSGSVDPRSSSFELVDVGGERGLDRVLRSGGAEKLLILENVGTGCALLDADGDGRLDIFLANAGTIAGGKTLPGPGSAFYRQTAAGTFEDRTQVSGLSFRGWGTGVAAGDVDNDGDPDLFLACYGRNRMYINGGDGTFEEASESMGLRERDFSTSAVFLDYDADGFLDLYVVNYVRLDLTAPVNDGEPCLQRGIATACGPSFYEPEPDRLYRSARGRQFRDVTAAAGMSAQPGGYGLGVAPADFDGDGWTDLYVANDSTANYLWRNLGNGTFEEVALMVGTALSETGQGQAGMGVDAGDADGDGHPDLFVTNYAEEYFAYYRNLGGGYFEDASHRAGLARETYMSLGWGTRWADFDNDGDLDLLVANGHVYPQAPRLNSATAYLQPCLLYRNDGTGRFTEVGAKAGKDVREPRAHRSLAVGDLDGDGDLDALLSVQDGRAVLLENRVRSSASWLRLRLRGTRSNREGIGARVELSAGGKRQTREVTRGGGYLGSHDARLHFGLGSAKRVEELIVRWPSRLRERFSIDGINREVEIVEGKGSPGSQTPIPHPRPK